MARDNIEISKEWGMDYYTDLKFTYEKTFHRPMPSDTLQAISELSSFSGEFDKMLQQMKKHHSTNLLVPTEQLVKAVVEKVDQPLVQPVAQEETMQQEPIRKEITPIITTEEIVAPKAEVEQPQPQVRKRYHVIVASVATEGEVHTMVDRLKSAGNDEAQAIIGDGKIDRKSVV